MENIFFDSIESVIRIFIIGILAYISIIILLRVSGKRTLSKMNAFDFIVTVALGSTLATVLINKNVPLLDGVLAFAVLIYLQYLLTYLSVRNKKLSNLVKSTPALLVYKGVMLTEMMKKERIDEDEIYSTLRKKGLTDLKEADAIVLETDGSLTVITTVDTLDSNELKKIKKPAHLHG